MKQAPSSKRARADGAWNLAATYLRWTGEHISMVVLGVLLWNAPVTAAEVAHPIVVTLGTAGGPQPRVERSQPANAVVIADAVYLFDVGDGIQRQLAAAGLQPANIKAIFISHHHIDHNGGLGPLLVNRWLIASDAPVPVIGPPGTVAMVSGLSAAFRATELAPITIGGPPKPKVAASVAARDLPSELSAAELIFADDRVRVFAITNDHYHYPDKSEEQRFSRSYSYRVECGGRSVVFTGDTGPSAHVEALAKGADLLVSEVIDLERERQLLEHAPLPKDVIPGLLEHLSRDHLTSAQVGLLASRAGVKQVVLTHLVPGLDGETDLRGYTRGAEANFKGPIQVAKDLDHF